MARSGLRLRARLSGSIAFQACASQGYGGVGDEPALRMTMDVACSVPDLVTWPVARI